MVVDVFVRGMQLLSLKCRPKLKKHNILDQKLQYKETPVELFDMYRFCGVRDYTGSFS